MSVQYLSGTWFEVAPDRAELVTATHLWSCLPFRGSTMPSFHGTPCASENFFFCFVPRGWSVEAHPFLAPVHC